MRALILNSGTGSRMGDITDTNPKAMTDLNDSETILSRQLSMLAACGISDVVITTGAFEKSLRDYCISLKLPLNYTFVYNPLFAKTNYIYSVYLAKEHLEDELVFLHGDLVFDHDVLADVLNEHKSVMVTSSTLALPDKDFKAVIDDGKVKKVGVEFFTNAVAAQPLYKLLKDDWQVWLDRIIEYCEDGKVTCYAENAFNEVSDVCRIFSYDVKNRLCAEVDTPSDLERVKELI